MENLHVQKETAEGAESINNLFPVFLKLEEQEVLLVGAGKVGLEKLTAILRNSPATKVSVVATKVSVGVEAFATAYANVTVYEKAFDETDLDGKNIVVVAVDNKETSRVIRNLAKRRNLLVNVADTPDLCDFYLGSIVQKGAVKIAISTNGKSPTVAKRLKEVLHDSIPEEINGVAANLSVIRENLSGDFEAKVKQLNELTKTLVSKQMTLDDVVKPEQKLWQKIVVWCLFAFVFMIIGHTVLSYVPFDKLMGSVKTLPQYIDTKMFFMMLLCGFLAQMSDGSLGMGYGTISTTFLLAIGVNPAIVSSRVHAARVFSSGVSGYSHHRFGNINKKLFKALVIPGVVGAALGATMAYFGQQYADRIRLPLSLYTIYLGYTIFRKAFGKPSYEAKVKRAGWLAAIGGFMDAFAGGGWGTLVTSTLMSKRRSPRYVIGSVCLAEFFVVFVSSMVFFVLLENFYWLDILGLILGGVIAAPIAARLVGKLPMKTMFILIGSLVILTSCNTLWKALSKLL